MDTTLRYLDPVVVSRLKNMELRARLIVEGFITGMHKSPYHGFSVEFAEHRPYNPGDELRHVDWKVYAKTDRHYVKQFEEETNLRHYVVLDTSPSMRYRHQSALTKLEYGAYLATGCVGCHGMTLSGGKIPGGPPGTPEPANITPDPETGIGRWTQADFVRVLREGIRPDGRQVDAFMPVAMTKEFTDMELEAIWKYLRTVEPKAFGNR